MTKKTSSGHSILLYAPTAEALSLMRKVFSQTGLPVIACCADGVLLESAKRHSGCVVLPAHECTNDEIRRKVLALRKERLGHAVVVVDKAPNFERAREILHLPVCDYFQLSTAPAELMKILRGALRWTETKGRSLIRHIELKAIWGMMDESHRQVLRLLFFGRTNREIADELSLSLRAIETRRARLLTEFQARSFAELIRAAATVFAEE